MQELRLEPELEYNITLNRGSFQEPECAVAELHRNPSIKYYSDDLCKGIEEAVARGIEAKELTAISHTKITGENLDGYIASFETVWANNPLKDKYISMLVELYEKGHIIQPRLIYNDDSQYLLPAHPDKHIFTNIEEMCDDSPNKIGRDHNRDLLCRLIEDGYLKCEPIATNEMLGLGKTIKDYIKDFSGNVDEKIEELQKFYEDNPEMSKFIEKIKEEMTNTTNHKGFDEPGAEYAEDKIKNIFDENSSQYSNTEKDNDIDKYFDFNNHI